VRNSNFSGKTKTAMSKPAHWAGIRQPYEAAPMNATENVGFELIDAAAPKLKQNINKFYIHGASGSRPVIQFKFITGQK
jgi:hypothetical protein